MLVFPPRVINIYIYIYMLGPGTLFRSSPQGLTGLPQGPPFRPEGRSWLSSWASVVARLFIYVFIHALMKLSFIFSERTNNFLSISHIFEQTHRIFEANNLLSPTRSCFRTRNHISEASTKLSWNKSHFGKK